MRSRIHRYACAAILFAVPMALSLAPAVTHAVPARAAGKDPAIEQQIDIQDINLTTTSTAYVDSVGSGSFLWNAARYSSLQHVYFEAGIDKQGVPAGTIRVRSADISSSLVSGTTYKVRIAYGCSYNSSANTFTETGFAELWSSDGTVQVTASAVSSTINSGTGTCPATPATVGVRFSRLIILQSDPVSITNTDTSINIGHNEKITPTTTADQPLTSPKLWMYTDHTLHPTAGWDSIQDVLFSATLASPRGTPVYGCLYDVTSSTEITCVTTSSTTPTYVTSGDVSTQLHDGDQYETYVRTATAKNTVNIYNAFVTVQQSSAAGLASFELYDDFNPYPVTSTSQTTYSPQHFLNLWEPSNFNLDTTQTVPSTSEVLSFHFEATESTNGTAPASAILENGCYGASCTEGVIVAANADSSSSAYARARTPNNSFPMPPGEALDVGAEIKGASGTATLTTSWLVINATVIPAYSVQETQNIAYGPEPYETLDQCTPVNAPANRPGIIVIHGGLWSASDKDDPQFSTLCTAYAAEGYVVDNINYRLTAKKFGNYEWPTQIGDMQLAVRYMRSTAPQTNLDPTHICAYGWSSGSQLGLLADELQTIHTADVSSQLQTYPTNTNCVVDFFGPTDMTRLYSEDPTLDQNFIVPLMDGQTPTSAPDTYTDASPADNITPQTGPVIVIQGTQDDKVPPDQAQELLSGLQAAGIPNNFLQYVGGHAFAQYPTVNANMIREEIDAWLVGQEHP